MAKSIIKISSPDLHKISEEFVEQLKNTIVEKFDVKVKTEFCSSYIKVQAVSENNNVVAACESFVFGLGNIAIQKREVQYFA